MKIRFTKAPTFTKGIIAAAVFAIIYLASTFSGDRFCQGRGITVESH
jgi:hypothetical protein